MVHVTLVDITGISILKSIQYHSFEDQLPVDKINGHQEPLLLTWFNFNPSMDK